MPAPAPDLTTSVHRVPTPATKTPDIPGVREVKLGLVDNILQAYPISLSVTEPWDYWADYRAAKRGHLSLSLRTFTSITKQSLSLSYRLGSNFRVGPYYRYRFTVSPLERHELSVKWRSWGLFCRGALTCTSSIRLCGKTRPELLKFPALSNPVFRFIIFRKYMRLILRKTLQFS